MPDRRLRAVVGAPIRRLVPRDALRRVRPAAQRLGLTPPGEWWQVGPPPWRPPTSTERAAPAWCNVCRWSGSAFLGSAHAESATCPRCGSVARDRFLSWCVTHRMGRRLGARVLETSPRLGAEYRQMMRSWYAYRASDYDLGAHRADLQLDLQNIALRDADVDILVTPHVLEHVPDTDAALAEIRRVLAPSARMYLQVPLLQGVTAPPREPEFHADHTPVFWRFGWDLTARLRAAGFRTTVLVTEPYAELLAHPPLARTLSSDEFDLPSLLCHVRVDDLTVVASDREATAMGWEPPFHFATWECIREG